MQTLLQKTRLIGDQHGIWTAQLFQHVIAELIPRCVCIPTLCLAKIAICS
jgi:hypothetical protein